MSSVPATLPGLLAAQAAQRPKTIALRMKRRGIWHEISWAEYATFVRDLALGLSELGVGAGDRLAILAENEPSWVFCDLAAQLLRASSVGLYPTWDPDEIAAALAASRASVVVCGDQEQVDKVLDSHDSLPGLKTIVALDTKGLHTRDYHDAPLTTFEALRARGGELAAAQPSRFDELVAAVQPGDVATIAFTPGTTGPSKGVLLTQEAETQHARTLAAVIELRDRDRGYSLLPLAHPTPRLFDVYAPLVAGSSTGFAESSESVLADLVELRPTVLVGSPRLLERVHGDVQARIERAAKFKRLVFNHCMSMLERALAHRIEGKSSALDPLRRAFARGLVGKAVLDKAGFPDVRVAAVGGGYVSVELQKWMWALGVPVLEYYGTVETGGLAFMQRGLEDLGTAGRPLDEALEARIAAGGELELRGPGLATAYLDGSPLAGVDSWFRTGDVARLDEQGRLRDLDRVAHRQETSSGQEIRPAVIEGALASSPYIARALVIASARPYVSSLVCIQEETVGTWARRHGIAVTTYASLAGAPEVVDLIAAEIERINASLPAERRIQGFRLLPRPLGQELSPMGTVRRTAVEDAFAKLVNELYGAEPAHAAARS